MGEILFFRGEDALDDWEKFWGFLGVKNTRTRKGWLQPRLSRYVSSYSRCFYPYSISPFGCFWKFNVLLIGVDEKGHNLFWWYWLLIFFCLKPVVIFPTSLSPSKNHEMWLYRLFSIFIIFILWCLLVLSSFSLFWIIPPSFLMIVYKHSIWADSFGKIKIERTLCSI